MTLVLESTAHPPGDRAELVQEVIARSGVRRRVEMKAPDLHRFAKSPGRLWIVGKGGTILSRAPMKKSGRVP